MPRYYLHCTDGVDFVLDEVGHEIEVESELMWFAYRAADRLMGELPDYDGWPSWLVVVRATPAASSRRCPSPVPWTGDSPRRKGWA
jgi:hypothetical protein